MFGWKLASGARLIRTVFIEVGRKNGKTEFAAGLALLLLVGDGEYGGQGYAMAVDRDQAKIVFNKALVMVGLSDRLAKHIEAQTSNLFCPQLMAIFRPISSTPASKHGFSPSFSIGDEIHAWPNGDLADVVHKGTAARRQPLEVLLTTAGAGRTGYGYEMHEYALKVLKGERIDPAFYAAIYSIGESDDWTDETVWPKANPNMPISPKIEFLRAECEKAKENPRLENEFKRYHLNIWTEQVTRWLSLAKWDAGFNTAAGDLPWQDLAESLRGRRAWSGVDLSTKIDLTALVHIIPPEDIDGRFYIVPRLFMPEEQIETAEKRDKLPYGEWVKAGAIFATPGDVIDYAFIEQQLRDDAELLSIEEVAFDPWNAAQFATRMQAEEMTMIEFRQGWSMSGPSKDLEALVISRRLAHGGHPALREQIKAVSVVTDPKGNIRPDKSKTTLHIDGIVAGVMGLGRALVAKPEQRSVYETRGIREIGVPA